MGKLTDESELFKELQERLKQYGDTKQNFFDCIRLTSEYEKEERLFVLYRLKQLSSSETGIDLADTSIKILDILMNKHSEYGFYTAVIEASLK